MRILLLLPLLGACWTGGAAPAGEPTPPTRTSATGPSCESIIPKMTELTVLSAAQGGADGDLLTEIRRDAVAIEPALIQACITDAWSGDLRRCIAAWTPEISATSDACESLVTPVQLEHVKAIRSGPDGA